jgi:hypothetical protein
MGQFTFARHAKIGVTEHNAAPVHSIQSGLWNLAVMHFLLYNTSDHPTLLDNTFIFDQVGKQYDWALYNSDITKDYSNWALWINGNLRGTTVLAASTEGNLNQAGNPSLLVTATKDQKNLYIEVINRAPVSITNTVQIKNGAVNESAMVYTMAEGVLPDRGIAKSLGAQFNYTFPSYSATMIKFSLKS